MATTASELPKVAKGKKQEDVGQIPQWKLMVRRFSQSKLSVGALIVLGVMYTITLIAS